MHSVHIDHVHPHSLISVIIVIDFVPKVGPKRVQGPHPLGGSKLGPNGEIFFGIFFEFARKVGLNRV